MGFTHREASGNLWKPSILALIMVSTRLRNPGSLSGAAITVAKG